MKMKWQKPILEDWNDNTKGCVTIPVCHNGSGAKENCISGMMASNNCINGTAPDHHCLEGM